MSLCLVDFAIAAPGKMVVNVESRKPFTCTPVSLANASECFLHKRGIEFDLEYILPNDIADVRNE